MLGASLGERRRVKVRDRTERCLRRHEKRRWSKLAQHGLADWPRRARLLALHSQTPELLADAELTDNGGVAPCIVGFKVVEETATSADHHEEAAARAVVLLMEFEMVRQLANARAEQRDLHFGTAGVAVMRAVLAYNALLMFGG